jgi:rhamnosyltransferase
MNPIPRTSATSRNEAQGVCAVVVAYFPDDGFSGRLRIIAPQVDALVVVDNTLGQAGAWQTELTKDRTGRIHLISNRVNLGIAKALNQGLEYALKIDCRWILTLDQDSQCHPGMVQALLQTASSCEDKPVVIGGNYFDAKRGRHEVTVDGTEDCLERKTVITSGCMVDATFAQRIGGYREDYFIDQVDHEFCLRVRRHGRRVVISRKPVMDHSVGGHRGPKVPLLGMMLPDHSALRKYYITRNSVATVRAFWTREPAWSLVRMIRLFLGLPAMLLLEKDKSTKARAFAAGLRDGLGNRMGPCRHPWLTGE